MHCLISFELVCCLCSHGFHTFLAVPRVLVTRVRTACDHRLFDACTCVVFHALSTHTCIHAQILKPWSVTFVEVIYCVCCYSRFATAWPTGRGAKGCNYTLAAARTVAPLPTRTQASKVLPVWNARSKFDFLVSHGLHTFPCRPKGFSTRVRSACDHRLFEACTVLRFMLI